MLLHHRSPGVFRAGLWVESASGLVSLCEAPGWHTSRHLGVCTDGVRLEARFGNGHAARDVAGDSAHTAPGCAVKALHSIVLGLICRQGFTDEALSRSQTGR